MTNLQIISYIRKRAVWEIPCYDDRIWFLSQMSHQEDNNDVIPFGDFMKSTMSSSLSVNESFPVIYHWFCYWNLIGTSTFARENVHKN